jgi:hypothetical protein
LDVHPKQTDEARREGDDSRIERRIGQGKSRVRKKRGPFPEAFDEMPRELLCELDRHNGRFVSLVQVQRVRRDLERL